MRSSHTAWLLAALVLALVPTAASAATTPASIVLRPNQIGPGYQLKTRSDSSCVKGCVTLDLCGYAFTTEALRTARTQLNYRHPAPAVQISNEVVLYRKGGAARSLAEVRKAVATCPDRPVKSAVAGVPDFTYRLTPFRAPGLLKASIALKVHVTGRSKGKAVAFSDVFIYQVRGNALSVVYAFRGGTRITLKQQLAVAERAAAASAANLRRAVR